LFILSSYPTRRPYDGFLKRYKLLAPKLVSKTNKMKPKEYCEAIIRSLGVIEDGYQFGLTKIFLRAGLLARFEKMRTGKSISDRRFLTLIDLMNNSAIKIQKIWKGLLARRRYAKEKTAAVRLQSVVRMVIASRLATKIRRNNAAIKIQKTVRMFFQKNKFRKVKRAAVITQSGK
jgi:myosin-5